MLSSVSGSTAVLMTALVAHYGLEYLFAASILTGVIQLIMGTSKLGKLMNYVPHAVIVGFVNALAILILLAQLKNFAGESWPMYLIVAGTLLIIFVFPKITKVIPSPLVAVVIMTLVTIALKVHTQTVGDIAHINTQFPPFHIPAIAWTWRSLFVILPVSFSLAVVGSAETLLTQTMIDDITGTKTNKDRELNGQGLANLTAGFFSGMAGCALVAESCMNARLGGRSRFSTVTAAVVLLVLVQLLGPTMSSIPMAALVGVMLMICFNIFDWKYLFQIHRVPKTESITMIATVAVVLPTHNLALGVLVGVIISAIAFVQKSSKIVVQQSSNGHEVTYRVQGQLFFASVNQLEDRIDMDQNVNDVCLDLSAAHVWDHAAFTSIEKVSERLKNEGKNVRVEYGSHSLPNLI